MKAYSSHSLKVSLVALSAALLAACSQSPAQVVMKGSDFYGKGNAPSGIQMASAAVRATPVAKPAIVMAAPVPEITVADAEPVRMPNIQSRDLPAPQIREPQMVATMPREEEVMTAAAQPEAAMLPEPQAIAPVDVSRPTIQPVRAAAGSGEKFVWPVAGGKVLTDYGPKAGGTYNDGINIAAREGEPVYSAADGTVIYAGNELRGYGNMVIVKHADGFVTAYAHTSRMLVRKGDKVLQGDQIALVGKTGSVDKAQLHFSLRKGKEPVNPHDYLNSTNFASR